MILFIANHPFPDSTGFSNRCRNALNILRSLGEVVVLCRSINTSTDPDTFETPSGPVQIERFRARFKGIERTENSKYQSVFYEIVRGIDLWFGLAGACFRLMRRGTKREPVHVYCVNAPLTVPCLVVLLSLVTRVRLDVLEFHDLEPEMARHMKGLEKGNLIMRIEYFLERFVVGRFRSIIVTNQTQKNRIEQRTGKPTDAIVIYPNTVSFPAALPDCTAARKQFGLTPEQVLFVYSGNLTYDYTIRGLVEFIAHVPELGKKLPALRVIIAGEGDGLPIVQKAIIAAGAEAFVQCPGQVSAMSELFAAADVGMIPWDHNILSETILPTKLLEYMAAGLPIIAPAFGEFSHVVEHEKNGLLYSTIDELLAEVIRLATDSTVRLRLGKAARTTFESQFDPEQQAAIVRNALITTLK